MPVCGNISLTIENDGNTVATAYSNSVTWTVNAGGIANSVVTCMSTIEAPKVTVTGKFIAVCLKAASVLR